MPAVIEKEFQEPGAVFFIAYIDRQPIGYAKIRWKELPDSKEWALGQLLQGERDTLGFYLSGHPFDPYRDEVRELVGCDLGALDRIWSSQSGRGGGDGEKRWRPEVSAILAGKPDRARKVMQEHCDDTAALLRGLVG